MSNEELVAHLNEYAEWCDANEWEIPIDMGDLLRDAAMRLPTTCQDCKWDKPDILLDKHWCTRLLSSMEVCADDYCSYSSKK